MTSKLVFSYLTWYLLQILHIMKQDNSKMKKRHNKCTIAIETSGRTGSAAVYTSEGIVLEMVFSGQMKHSAELFTTLDVLLSKADAIPSQIGKVCIAAGPGSFTGLRIAVTAAKMFAFSQNSKIIAADTMDVLAENATELKTPAGEPVDCILTVLDAKKGYFYTAVFDRTGSGWKKCLPTSMMTSEQLIKWLTDNGKNNVGVLGEGLLFYAKQFQSPLTFIVNEQFWTARASNLLRIADQMSAAGRYADPAKLIPIYISNPDAIVKTGR